MGEKTPTLDECRALLERVPEGYTDGPWRKDRNGFQVRAPRNGKIGHATERFMSRSEREANALLFAFAPDLADAVRALVGMAETLEEENAEEADLHRRAERGIQAQRDHALTRIATLEADLRSSQIREEAQAIRLDEARAHVEALSSAREAVAMLVPMGESTGTVEQNITEYVSRLVSGRNTVMADFQETAMLLREARAEVARLRKHAEALDDEVRRDCRIARNGYRCPCDNTGCPVATYRNDYPEDPDHA